MGLFLPILLLGFAQIAEQSVPATPVQHSTQNAKAAVLSSPTFTLQSPSKDQSGIPHWTFREPDPEPNDQNLCFTMRTYLFERRNGFAPEPVGMTTCQPASVRHQKRVLGRPRVVPAN